MDPAGGAGKGISGRLIGAVSGKQIVEPFDPCSIIPLSGSIRFPVRFPPPHGPVRWRVVNVARDPERPLSLP